MATAQPSATTTTTTLSVRLTGASLSTTTDGAEGSSSTTLAVTTLEVDVAQQTGTDTAASAESPLLAAFRKLSDALQPAAPSGTSEAGAASGLSNFLRQLATALRSGPDASGSTAPTQGSLVSLAV